MPVWNMPPSVHFSEPSWGSGPMAGKLSLHSWSCVNALKKERAPLGSSYNGRKSPYGDYLVSEPISSFHPWKATAKHETISSALGTENKGIWQPILWSSHNRFLEASPVFGILTQVLSSDEIPFAWPWWFWLQFSDNQVCFEQRTERRGQELKGGSFLIHPLEAIQPWVNTDLHRFSDHYLNGLSVIIHYDYLIYTACVN